MKDVRLTLAAGDDLRVPLPLASLLRDRFLTLLANGGDNSIGLPSVDWQRRTPDRQTRASYGISEIPGACRRRHSFALVVGSKFLRRQFLEHVAKTSGPLLSKHRFKALLRLGPQLDRLLELPFPGLW